MQGAAIIGKALRIKYDIAKKDNARFPLIYAIRPGIIFLPPWTCVADAYLDAIKEKRGERLAGKIVPTGGRLVKGAENTLDVFGNHLENVAGVAFGEIASLTPPKEGERPSPTLLNMIKDEFGERRKEPVVGGKKGALARVQDLREQRLQRRNGGGLFGFGLLGGTRRER